VGGCDICHHPDENGGTTIRIPDSAWPAHRSHGDYLGACNPQGAPEGGVGTPDDYEKIVASYIQNDVDPIFSYYDENWPDDVVRNPLIQEDRLLHTRLVEIGVRVNINPAVNPDDFSTSTMVHLRNLKENL
jgi:hypothetical protein